MVKLGDFVRFVDEKMEGYVTRIIDDKTVGVTTEDFEIPVLISKVTRVHGEGTEKAESGGAAPSAQPVESFRETGILLAVTSNPRMASVVNFQLVNTTSYQLAITFQTERSGKVKGEFAGILPPASVTPIFTASLSELSAWPRFVINILYYTTNSRESRKPLEYTEKFTAKDFSGAKKTIPLVEQPGWEFVIDPQEVAIDPQKLKESFFRAPAAQTIVARPLSEIDLHIEKLRDDHQFLTSPEMLTIQLAEFRKNFDAAIVHKLSSMIFIHGSGNGTLRHEIHKVLSKHPEVKTFMDARKEKFGYGATEVVFR